jgi:hypothetical protein
MKRYLLGALLGGACLFATGFVIYVLLMPNPAFANGPAAATASRAAPDLPPIIVAELLFGFLLTRALTKSGAIGSVGSSVTTAAMIGGIVALAYSLLIYGTTEVVSLRGVVYEAITWVVRWGITGAVLSMAFGRQKAEAPAVAI